MLLLSSCNSVLILVLLKYFNVFYKVICVLIPIIVMVLGFMDIFGCITSGDMNKLREKIVMCGKRLIAGFLVLLIPTVLSNAMDLLLPVSNSSVCISVKENKIDSEIERIIEEKLEMAEKNNDMSIYDEVIAYLRYVNDKSKYASYRSRLDEIKKAYKESLKESFNKRYEEDKSKPKKPVKKNEEAIKPSENESVTNTLESDTLKVYVSKVNSYYLTRIWVKDAYTQLNKQDSPQYGSTLYKPITLLNNAISQNGLQDKIVVGFNASGFYLRNTYDADSVNRYGAYDKTSVGTLVITNGSVVRNAYDKSFKTWYTVGVDTSNTLRIFEDYKTDNTNEKQSWSQNVISSGIRNTFTFAGPLVDNGVASNVQTSMPGAGSKLNRQAICQIDANNFVLITGSNLNRTDLINIMLGLNCQTGSNFDGGGSIALFVKDKGSSEIKTIIGGGRALPEVGYFTEE